MNFKKRATMFLLAGAMTLSSSVFAFASNDVTLSDGGNGYSTESTIVITPFDMDVISGSVSNSTEFSSTKTLNRNNGSKVNFYIKNTGSVDVKITINGANATTYAPGQSGHITASVTGTAQSFTFKAVPTPNGGKISLDYIVAQRD